MTRPRLGTMATALLAEIDGPRGAGECETYRTRTCMTGIDPWNTPTISIASWCVPCQVHFLGARLAASIGLLLDGARRAAIEEARPVTAGRSKPFTAGARRRAP